MLVYAERLPSSPADLSATVRIAAKLDKKLETVVDDYFAALRAVGFTARAQAEPIYPGPDHLRSAPPAPARSDRAHPQTHRYRITIKGLRTAIFYTRLYNRSLRTGLAVISPAAINPDLPMAKSIRAAETALDKWFQHEKIAA
jgi:hypothetical protein